MTGSGLSQHPRDPLLVKKCPGHPDKLTVRIFQSGFLFPRNNTQCSNQNPEKTEGPPRHGLTQKSGVIFCPKYVLASWPTIFEALYHFFNSTGIKSA